MTSWRIYLCPVVGDGKSYETAFAALVGRHVDPGRPRIADIPHYVGVNQTIPVHLPPHPLAGKPRFNWTIASGIAVDWSHVEADPRCELLFSGLRTDVPDLDAVREELYTHRLSELPNYQDVIDSLARRGITGALPDWTWAGTVVAVRTHLLGFIPLRILDGRIS
jgi:hypothetical protein